MNEYTFNVVAGRLNWFALCLISLWASMSMSMAADTPAVVVTHRVPQAGIQPQVVVADNGAVHLIYFKGDAAAGDIFYCRAEDSLSEFCEPIRVNSQPGSAIAVGTIRGPHMAVGRAGRVHVSWNGSSQAKPPGLANPDLPEDSPYRYGVPMLYARLDETSQQFEAQRNLMTHTFSLDGGGSVAADLDGNVYVVWHANSLTSKVHDESARAVWVACSHDDGATFAAETRANLNDTGACGCCGLRAFVDQRGELWVLFRSAEKMVNRDMHALVSKDQANNFISKLVDRWEIPQCAMSSAAIVSTGRQTLAAWETSNRVKFGALSGPKQLGLVQQSFGPPLVQSPQKHPVLAVNSRDQILLVWTEGTGWQKGGAVAWQAFDLSGAPLANSAGRLEGLPVWSFAAVMANDDDTFTILY